MQQDLIPHLPSLFDKLLQEFIDHVNGRLTTVGRLQMIPFITIISKVLAGQSADDLAKMITRGHTILDGIVAYEGDVPGFENYVRDLIKNGANTSTTE